MSSHESFSRPHQDPFIESRPSPEQSPNQPFHGLTDLAAYAEVDVRDATDDGRYETENCFSTRTEAVKAAKWICASVQYIRGSHMEACIERLIETRHIAQKVAVSRDEP